MRFPCETVVKGFLTSFRHALIRELKARGKTQQQVADLLHLTQAAVSTYLKKEQEPSPVHDAIVKSLVPRAADLLGGEGIIDVMDMVCHACKVNRFPNQPFCTAHLEEIPALEQEGCIICSKYLDTSALHVEGERGDILHDLVVAARQACSLPGFPALIPQVQSNMVLGFVDPNKNNIEDYAAFPGRIIKMDREAIPVGTPAFGASIHLARIVSITRRHYQDVRCAMCLRHGDDIDMAMKKAGLHVVLLDDENDEQGLSTALADDAPRVPDALTFSGAVGLEGLTYLLGSSAHDVIGKLEKIC